MVKAFTVPTASPTSKKANTAFVSSSTPASKKAKTVATPTSKKMTKAKKPTHPPFIAMVIAAVESLKERKGSSRHAILKYIMENYSLEDEKRTNVSLKLALKKGVSSGVLTQVKGAGASGSFKVFKEEKPPKKTEKKLKTDKKTASKKHTKESSSKTMVLKLITPTICILDRYYPYKPIK